MPVIILIIGLLSTGLVEAASFQEQVTRSFPGFEILDRREFAGEAIKDLKSNPALVTGKFKQDSNDDFAALIRSLKKKVNKSPGNKYDYYDGKLIACMGQKGSGYRCQEISKMPITIPYQSYIVRTGHKKTNCSTGEGSSNVIDVKTDAIGWYFPEKGGSDYIYQPDGHFLNCVTSD